MPGGRHGFLRRRSAEPVSGRHSLRGRRFWRGPRPPYASICDISSFPTEGKSSCQPTSPIGPARTVAKARAAQGSENNFGHRNPGRRLSVEPTAPGGVPPSPQPLTHPAIDPGPFGRGLPFLGRASRKRARTRGPLPRDKPRAFLSGFPLAAEHSRSTKAAPRPDHRDAPSRCAHQIRELKECRPMGAL